MPSKARAGLNQLLRNYPEAEIAKVVNQDQKIAKVYEHTQGSIEPTGPWTLVDLLMLRWSTIPHIEQFAIWNHTGNVHRIQGADDEYPGAVEEYPFIIVTTIREGQ